MTTPQANNTDALEAKAGALEGDIQSVKEKITLLEEKIKSLEEEIDLYSSFRSTEEFDASGDHNRFGTFKKGNKEQQKAAFTLFLSFISKETALASKEASLASDKTLLASLYQQLEGYQNDLRILRGMSAPSITR